MTKFTNTNSKNDNLFIKYHDILSSWFLNANIMVKCAGK